MKLKLGLVLSDIPKLWRKMILCHSVKVLYLNLVFIVLPVQGELSLHLKGVCRFVAKPVVMDIALYVFMDEPNGFD